MEDLKLQYELIATNYNEEIKGQVFYEKLVNPTVRKMLGDVKGKSILDVACGDGIRTIMMKQLGADKIVGVDISSEMINIARKEAEKNNVDIEFIVNDCSQIKSYGEFDIVTAFFLHPYARTREIFLDMCKLIHKNTKKGGMFVGITQAVKTLAKDKTFAAKHGFQIGHPMGEGMQDGDIVTVTFTFGKPFTINIYYMRPETYEWAFKEAGFSHFEWFPLDLYESDSKEDREWYKDVIAHPNITGFRAW